MSIKPILFNTEMVKAILDGQKTVTRRVVRGAWPDWSYLGLTDDAAVTAVDRYGKEYPKPVDGMWAEFEDADGPVEFPMVKTPYHPGDILWVRETWGQVNESVVMGLETKKIIYRANYSDIEAEGWKWRPSIHMPREAARIWLRVTGVRVERLFDSFFKPGTAIFDLRAEGITLPEVCIDCIDTYGHPCCNDEDCEGGSECGNLDGVRDDFATLWDSTIKFSDRDRYGWAASPWVWVIEFERCERPEGRPL